MAIKCPVCGHVGLRDRDFELSVVSLTEDHQEPGLLCYGCGLVNLAVSFTNVPTTIVIRYRSILRLSIVAIVLILLLWWIL